MILKKSISIFIMILGLLNLHGQNSLKYEKEVSIKCQLMPLEAQKLIAPLMNEAKKIRFYKEYDLITTTYECKFMLENRKVSIEFDSVGNLFEIELLVKVDELNDSVWSAIQGILNSDLKKVKIRRLQKQFLMNETNRDEVSYIYQIVKHHVDMLCNYEIEVEGTKDNQLFLFEYLFSHNAQVLNKRQIIKPDDANILY